MLVYRHTVILNTDIISVTTSLELFLRRIPVMTANKRLTKKLNRHLNQIKRGRYLFSKKVIHKPRQLVTATVK